MKLYNLPSAMLGLVLREFVELLLTKKGAGSTPFPLQKERLDRLQTERYIDAIRIA
jgi:hypothetical protein